LISIIFYILNAEWFKGLFHWYGLIKGQAVLLLILFVVALNVLASYGDCTGRVVMGFSTQTTANRGSVYSKTVTTFLQHAFNAETNYNEINNVVKRSIAKGRFLFR